MSHILLFNLLISVISTLAQTSSENPVSCDPTHPCNTDVNSATTRRRTTLNIFWSCVSTIAICTWVSVHPNIPKPKAKRRVVVRRRLLIMLCALVAPEMIIGWAMRQWFGAKRIALEFENIYRGTDYEWKKTHGFFLQMGGFMIQDGNETYTLTLPKLQQLLREKRLKLPKVTEQEIQDRSKGDALSKGFVLVQTTWFLAECIARHIAGLVVTELELVTAAFAALNVVMYYLWWNKPIDVRCPILLEVKPVPSHFDHRFSDMISPLSKEASSQGFSAIVSGYWSTFLASLQPAAEAIRENLTTPKNPKPHSQPSINNFGAPNRSRLDRILNLKATSTLLTMIESALFPMGPNTDTLPSSSAKRVPTFYALPLLDDEWYILGIVGLFTGVLFGGIHCIAWNFEFPSVAERRLWRAASVIVTCVPLYLALAMVIILAMKVTWEMNPRETRLVSRLLSCVGTLPYILARLILLFQAFYALRELSPSAYSVIRWTTVLPHL